MYYLSMIFFQVVAPILVLLVIGGVIQQRFQFNLKALSNLVTFCLMPAAIFLNIYETEVEAAVLDKILLYLFVFIFALMGISNVFVKILRLEGAKAAVFKNSIVLMNSGNYGLPVSQMVFSTQPLGTAIQIITIVVQNLTTYTYGLYNLIATSKKGLDILRDIIKLPIVHALVLGSFMNYFDIPLPQFLSIPLNHVADAFIAIALITLGAQLAKIKMKTLFNKMLYLSCFGRLILAPIVAMILIYLFRFDGVVAQSLLIASSFPTSRNSSSLALEYDVEPDLAAQTVLVTTIISCLTVTVVIYAARILYPI